MHTKQKLLLFINSFGGVAVLGSYAYGILTYANPAEILWGGVPQGIRPFYTAGMFLAAIGYFVYTYFILFRLNPDETRIYGQYGYGAFNSLYAAILIPSALWMPLTFLAVEGSSQVLFWLVRLVLVVVGAASICLLFALLHVGPRQPVWVYRFAVLGCVFFCLQTALLDTIVWGMYFRVIR